MKSRLIWIGPVSDYANRHVSAFVLDRQNLCDSIEHRCNDERRRSRLSVRGRSRRAGPHVLKPGEGSDQGARTGRDRRRTDDPCSNCETKYGRPLFRLVGFEPDQTEFLSRFGFGDSLQWLLTGPGPRCDLVGDFDVNLGPCSLTFPTFCHKPSVTRSLFDAAQSRDAHRGPSDRSHGDRLRPTGAATVGSRPREKAPLQPSARPDAVNHPAPHLAEQHS